MDWAELFHRFQSDKWDFQAFEILDAHVRQRAREELVTRGTAVIDDVVGDACATALMSIASARGPDTFGGYVRGHYLNARKRVLRALTLKSTSLPMDLAVSDAHDESSDQLLEVLYECVETLTDRERMAVRLLYFEEAVTDAAGQPGRDHEGWIRLTDDLELQPLDHPAPGAIGEYAMELEHQGERAAASASPEITAHLARGCSGCETDIDELRLFARWESKSDARDSLANTGRRLAHIVARLMGPSNQSVPPGIVDLELELADRLIRIPEVGLAY